jgi:mediator of replication checkpoint protein 1
VRYREQQNEDDERLEKEVNDVVAGKRRTRRRRGGAGGLLGSDASDDESSDDEEARALRRRLAKKRRVEGDTLDALARDPATASFHATYQMGLLDDADDFAHLDRDVGEDDVQENNQERGGEEDRIGDGGDVDEDVEMAAPSNADMEEISAARVRKELQDIARGKRVRSSCFALSQPRSLDCA